MAQFKTPGHSGQKRSRGQSDFPAPLQQFQILEPRCKICTHPQRREIDMMLALGWSQAAVIRHWNNIMELQGVDKSEWFRKSSMSCHVNKHLSIRDAAIQRIIETRARLEGIDSDSVEGFILTKAGVAESLIATGLESLHRGHTVVEPKVILDAIRILTELEQNRAAQAEEVMLREIKAFTTAVKKVVPEEQWEEIYRIYEDEVGRANAAILPGPSVQQEITVETEEAEEDEKYDQLQLFDVKEY